MTKPESGGAPSYRLEPDLGDACHAALDRVRADLAAALQTGHWVGRLSSSALSTATAVSALAVWRRAMAAKESVAADQQEFPGDSLAQRVDAGVQWMVGQVNSDGGFGDTDQSYSNISTTLLVQAALQLSGRGGEFAQLTAAADRYVAAQGSIEGLRARYGRDKTFAVPILANAAIAGLVPWSQVAALPFELACLPQAWYRFARLPVVSYAIPALVAIGQAKFHFDPPGNPLLRGLRRSAVGRSLRVLDRIQPASGGYLEAIPLTSFVVMALAASGRADHPVARRGIQFLCESQRADGGWPIDTNLATWVTNLSVTALANAPDSNRALLAKVDLNWIAACQNMERHPFTGAAPGGWGWSDLSGAVPDADDTPGALLALHALSRHRDLAPQERAALEGRVRRGLRWLVDLQNRDGGWPTFCRGWGQLPFDRSGSDLTAHALRACIAWPELLRPRDRKVLERGWSYLQRTQRPDGSWVPLWFGNQDVAAEENPVYGTCKVLRAYLDGGRDSAREATAGLAWLVAAQNPDGGWGGGSSICWENADCGNSSVEETALAVEILADFGHDGPAAAAFSTGAAWLTRAVGNGYHRRPSPIGFYFAKLWYYEELYPIIFTVAALSRALGPRQGAAGT